MTDSEQASGNLDWRTLVAAAQSSLAEAGVPDADISARLIGQRATGAEPGEWVEVLADAPHKRHLAHFDAMVERRCQGEPLQYVLGQWGFRHLDLFVDNRVLIPRPETETVAGLAVTEVESVRHAAGDVTPEDVAELPVIVADLGTGSGAIGLSVAYECSDVDVWLTDVSAAALTVARANLAGLGTKGSRVRLAEGSWFAALSPELQGRLSVVVSNPPYVGHDDDIDPQIRWEPADALFAEPAEQHLVHLVETATSWLHDAGSLILEMAPDQTSTIQQLAASLFDEATVHNDLAGRPRAVVARRPLQRN